MALTQRSEVDKVEVVGVYRCVQVREAVIIEEDGAEILRSYRRHVIEPGDDYSSEVPFVQGVCAAAHTADIIAAYEAARAGGQ